MQFVAFAIAIAIAILCKMQFLCSPKVQGQGQEGCSVAGLEPDAFFFPIGERLILPAVLGGWKSHLRPWIGSGSPSAKSWSRWCLADGACVGAQWGTTFLYEPGNSKATPVAPCPPRPQGRRASWEQLLGFCERSPMPHRCSIPCEWRDGARCCKNRSNKSWDEAGVAAV